MVVPVAGSLLSMVNNPVLQDRRDLPVVRNRSLVHDDLPVVTPRNVNRLERADAGDYRTVIRTALSAALDRAERSGEIAEGTAAIYVETLLPWMLGMSVIARSGTSNDELKTQLDAGRALIESWRVR